MENPLLTTERLELVPKTASDARQMVEAMSPGDRAQLSADWLAHVYADGPVSLWYLGYSIRDRATAENIGHCGFKGPPDSSGRVELAYGLAAEFEGRGFATEAARAAVSQAFRSEGVHAVRAHTLSQTNASARVLQKCGFHHCGEVTDPDDGLVQRWEILKAPATAAG